MLILWFTVIYFLPDILGGEREADCTMRTAFANAMFGWVICGSMAAMHLCFILGYLCKSATSTTAILKEYVEKSVMVMALFSMFI